MCVWIEMKAAKGVCLVGLGFEDFWWDRGCCEETPCWFLGLGKRRGRGKRGGRGSGPALGSSGRAASELCRDKT